MRQFNADRAGPLFKRNRIRPLNLGPRTQITRFYRNILNRADIFELSTLNPTGKNTGARRAVTEPPNESLHRQLTGSSADCRARVRANGPGGNGSSGARV